MILALFLLFFSPAEKLDLFPSQVVEVPAHDWGQFDILLNQRPALVDASFQVESGSSGLRMALLRHIDLERLRNGEPFGVLAATEFAASGHLRYQVRQPGRYAMVLDNRSGGANPAIVRLHVWLDFAASRVPTVTEISAARRLVVVLISCAVFFTIATFSLRRILHAANRP